MSNDEVIETNEVVYVAVKPNYVVPVLKELSATVKPNTLIVSIAAGVPTHVFEKVRFPTLVHRYIYLTCV